MTILLVRRSVLRDLDGGTESAARIRFAVNWMAIWTYVQVLAARHSRLRAQRALVLRAMADGRAGRLGQTLALDPE